MDKSYLSGRSYRVIVDKHLSERKHLSLSVLQGGCSSAYFIMYAATLFPSIEEFLNLFDFADDHALEKSFIAASRLDELDTIDRY